CFFVFGWFCCVWVLCFWLWVCGCVWGCLLLCVFVGGGVVVVLCLVLGCFWGLGWWGWGVCWCWLFFLDFGLVVFLVCGLVCVGVGVEVCCVGCDLFGWCGVGWFGVVFVLWVVFGFGGLVCVCGGFGGGVVLGVGVVLGFGGGRRVLWGGGAVVVGGGNTGRGGGFFYWFGIFGVGGGVVGCGCVWGGVVVVACVVFPLAFVVDLGHAEAAEFFEVVPEF
ncbi:hypothetical protein, partial [Pseudomonas syringae group genomosp. 7]|uniref:hypothetical protein n=1 Tax=Pseudomonas syringae group genomosp. 7 TaxID=251699 RepID=UPI00376F7C6F